jgi:hypothetical protein
MDLSYVSSDMMLQVKYNPSLVSPSSPFPSPANSHPSHSSWLETLYLWAVASLQKSEDDHLIATTIQSELYFSGLLILAADITDSYPFLGNGTVSQHLLSLSLVFATSSYLAQISFLSFPKFSIALAAVGGVDLSALSFLPSYLQSFFTKYFTQVTFSLPPSLLPPSLCHNPCPFLSTLLPTVPIPLT